MIWSLSETLKFVEPYLPHQLVSPKAFSHVQRMANLLPNTMSAYYLECRLGMKKTQVDFSTCAIAATGSREILAGHKGTTSLPDILLRSSLWSRACEFFRYWADPTSPLYKQSPLIWLEFDKVDEALLKIPLPSLGICLDPDYLKKPSRSQHSNHPSPRKYQPSIDTALELLLGHPVPPQTRQKLLACFDLLPGGGQISYVCVMLPRQPAAIKVNGFVPKERLLEYLTQIGWPGSVVEIEKILTRFCATMDKIRFDLTVGDTILSRVGLEFFFDASPQSNLQRQRLLNQFVESRLCTPDKQDALLTWSGFSSEKFSRQSFPTRLGRSWYAKIVYQPHHPLEAKGYLGFAPSFFSVFS